MGPFLASGESDVERLCLRRRTASIIHGSGDAGVRVWGPAGDRGLRWKHDHLRGGLGKSPEACFCVFAVIV